MAENFFEVPIEQLRQGDIFEALAFVRLELDEGSNNGVPAFARTSRMAVLVNQSCDIDKGYPRLTLLPIAPMSTLAPNEQGFVKKNRVFNKLYIPAFRDLVPESFVSFLEPMTVSRELLLKARRLATLSESSKRAFYVQHSRWITRWELAEMHCPKCGTSFHPSDTLPIENS